MQSELNKQSLKAIEKAVHTQEFWLYASANECEKIGLQAQIDLLNGLINDAKILNVYKRIQEQLNQLK